MTPQLLALLAVISTNVPAFNQAGGFVGFRDAYAPAATTTAQQLSTAIAGATCALRTVRVWGISPAGRIRDTEQNILVCGQDGIFQRSALTAFNQGWRIARVRVLGAAAGGETEPVDIAPECACTSGANCNAQRMNQNDTLQTAAALPRGTISGPDYRWRNPTGAGCVPMHCIETFAWWEWPAGCPVQ